MHDLLSGTRILFPNVGPCSADDSGSPKLSQLPVTLYEFLSAPHSFFGITEPQPELKGNNFLKILVQTN